MLALLDENATYITHAVAVRLFSGFVLVIYDLPEVPADEYMSAGSHVLSVLPQLLKPVNRFQRSELRRGIRSQA